MKTLTPDFLKETVAVASNAALIAGRHMLTGITGTTKIEFKGATDLVTRYDRECQELIYSVIKSSYPSHSIIGEEDLEYKGDNEFLWLIDPIDGTTNFAHKLPMFCVSIALLHEKTPVAGVVYVPVLDQLFKAGTDLGAELNNSPIEVSETETISDSLLATGFPYDRRDSDINNISHFNSIIRKCRGLRRMGSAAIDLCYTAAGIFDGYWELKLKPWDSAAGAVILKEAGGTITDFRGKRFDPWHPWCLATNGRIHKEMITILTESSDTL